mgnify:CR=1 FL=1
MTKEKVYNEEVAGDAGFAEGDGYPSCEGEPCANVADEEAAVTDTMAENPVAEDEMVKLAARILTEMGL